MHSKIIHKTHKAIELLNAGLLVAFPTETVYGLGADARNESALENVFKVKGRPNNHPLIVHIADLKFISNLASAGPDYALELAKQHWPGPITLILPKHPQVSATITGGQDTVAIRVPAHPKTLELLQAFPHGLVGPSANKFGHISPTRAEHVVDDLGLNPAFGAVLDGGACALGIESTIIDCTSDKPRILRYGSTSINLNYDYYTSSKPVSGNLKSHYAPKAKTFVIEAEKIYELLHKNTNSKIAILSLSHYLNDFSRSDKTIALWLTEQCNHLTYAKNLYANLRLLDKTEPEYILIERTPQTIEWQGINDRLRRASSEHSIADLFIETAVHD